MPLSPVFSRSRAARVSPLLPDPLFEAPARPAYVYGLVRRPLPLAPPVPELLFVLLSPSSTPAASPTLRRCDALALSLGCGAYRIAHVFGFPVRDPRELLAAADAGVDVVGSGCDANLAEAARSAPRILVAWGAYRAPLVRALVLPRVSAVTAQLLDLEPPVRLECLGVGSHGDPVHPLFVRRGRAALSVASSALGHVDPVARSPAARARHASPTTRSHAGP